MEKSVRDREEKRGLQDFKSTERLKSGFEDIVLAFKSLGKLKHASFGKKRGFQSCGKLKDVSFDKNLQSRRIEIAPVFQPCGKLKDVIFDKKLVSREIEIVRGFQPCGKLKDVSFDPKRESRRRNEIVGGGGKLKDASFDEESWRREIVSKPKYCSFSKPKYGSLRSKIDEEEYQESWESWNKMLTTKPKYVSFSKPKYDSSRSEIDEEEYQESWNKMRGSDIDECETSFGKKRDSQIDEEECKSCGSDIDECETSFVKKRDSRSQIDEEEYQKSWNKESRKSCGSDIDEEEYQESWNQESWNQLRKSWGSFSDGEEYYIGEEEAFEPTGRNPICRVPVWYAGGIIEVNSEIGRDFKHWHFCLRWGVDGCPPREQMILKYLKWIAKVLGSKEQALKSLLSVTGTYFICKLSRERAYWFMDFDEVFALFAAIYVVDVHGNITVGEYAEEGTRFSDEGGFYRRKLDAELPEDPVAIPPSKIHEEILSRIYAGVPE